MLKLVILICKGLIRDQRMRRGIMLYDVVAACVMLFAGSTFLANWLRQSPLLFMIFWAACAWLTLLAILFAIFDLLMVRVVARETKRKLERAYWEATQQRSKSGGIAKGDG